jgi:hypothetical protein
MPIDSAQYSLVIQPIRDEFGMENGEWNHTKNASILDSEF